MGGGEDLKNKQTNKHVSSAVCVCGHLSHQIGVGVGVSTVNQNRSPAAGGTPKNSHLSVMDNDDLAVKPILFCLFACLFV